MNNAIASISKFIPSCEQEEVDKRLFLKYLTEFPDVLTRDNLLCHFAASAFVINSAHDKVVAAYHNVYKSWGWLGGHADGDDDFARVARKEIEEESGLRNLSPLTDGIFSIDSQSVIPHFKNGKFVPAHVHLTVTYVFVASEKDALRIAEDENSDIAWFGFDELIEKSTEEHMKPVYKKIIAKIKGL